MLVNGIDAIYISVKDLDRSLGFFRDSIGLEEVAGGPADPAWLTGLWGLGQETGAETASLKHPEQATLLRLVQFSPGPKRYLRDGHNVYDYGLFDIAFRTKDVEASLERLGQEGFGTVSPPAVYTADWAQVTVKEADLEGPDRLPLALIQRLTGVVPFEGDFSVMIDCAQFCEDYEAALAFYVDLLGLTPAFDMELPQGLIDPVVQTPAGTTSRMAFLVKPGSPVPAVELIGTDAESRHLDRGEGVPAYGLFSLGFEVEDLDQALEKISLANYEILAGPLDLDRSGLPARRAALVEGPNRIALEFFEKA